MGGSKESIGTLGGKWNGYMARLGKGGYGDMCIKQFSSVSGDPLLLMASATIINLIGRLWTSLPLQLAF